MPPFANQTNSQQGKNQMTIKQIVSLAVGIIATFITLSVVFGSFYIIDAGERGVVLRNGAYKETAEPGLHWKVPIFEEVKRISAQSRIVTYDRVEGYSRDQQSAVLTVSVSYRFVPELVSEIYENYGDEAGAVRRVISPTMNVEFKTVFGQFNAVAAIQERERLNTDTVEAIREAVTTKSTAIVIEGVQIENIDFSDAYEDSIEQRMLAEVAVQRAQQVLLQEKVQAEITVTQAQAQADSTLARARSAAEATRLAGEAEAYAIEVKGEALKNNPGLVALTQAERWDGVLPSTMLPTGTVPILNVAQ